MSSTTDNEAYRFDTVAIHGAHGGDPTTKSRAIPIYQTTSYTFDDTDHAAAFHLRLRAGTHQMRIPHSCTSSRLG